MAERKFDRLMTHGFSVRGVYLQIIDMFFILCLFIFAFLIRLSFMPIESGDYLGFLKEWMIATRNAGGFPSLKLEISNYTPAYMYIMCLLSYISYSDLYLLKLASIFFDYAAGVAVFLIVYQMTKNSRKAILGMSILLLSPTVIINSAYWAQCDIIYTTFLLFAFYFLLRENSKGVFIFVGIALSFKLQALFFVPFLIIMWLKKYVVRFRDFLLIPIVYVISLLPAWMMGRSLRDLLLIYIEQADYYPWGTMEYPNIYVLLGEVMPELRHPEELGQAGVWLTVILLGCLAYYLYGKKFRLSYELVTVIALFSTAAVVYFLPHMHERYGFLIDLLAIIYGVTNIRKMPAAVTLIIISMMSYMRFLIGIYIIPFEYMALMQLAAILYIGVDMHRQIHAGLIIPESNP